MQTAIYVHVPFCLRRCLYCDFNTYDQALHLRPVYVDALRQEIRLRAERYRDVRATSLYFGGGTPSLLDPHAIPGIVHDARRYFSLPERAEVTMEANPGTVDERALVMLRQGGVNRLSLGVQSAHDGELAMLGRIHTWDDAVTAVQAARRAGFDNLSLDLIFALPGQSLADWEATLARVLALEPEHLSLYALTLEPGTRLAELVAMGDLPEPEADLAAEMYEAASERLCAGGFWQYEISNWARGPAGAPPPGAWALPPQGHAESLGPGICRHNLVYWRNQPWLGLGAGAYSWFRGRRWRNLPHPSGYLHMMHQQRLKGVDVEVIDGAMERGETMMMGLRLAEGVADARFRRRFGTGLEALYADTLAHWHDQGLLLWDGERARLSARGRLLGNQVFGDFLP